MAELVLWARARLDVQLLGVISSPEGPTTSSVISIQLSSSAIGSDATIGAVVGSIQATSGPSRPASFSLSNSITTTDASLGSAVGTLEANP